MKESVVTKEWTLSPTMPDCLGWVSESHMSTTGSWEMKVLLRSLLCLSFCLSVFLSFIPSISRCFALARCHTFLPLRLMGPLGNVVNVHSSARVITLSLPCSCSLPHLHGPDEDVDRAVGLQLAAGQCRLCLRGGETRRETGRNSSVTNMYKYSMQPLD